MVTSSNYWLISCLSSYVFDLRKIRAAHNNLRHSAANLCQIDEYLLRPTGVRVSGLHMASTLWLLRTLSLDILGAAVWLPRVPSVKTR